MNDVAPPKPKRKKVAKAKKSAKASISELGYEDVVEADDEQEAEEMALIHCKQYLHEYVDVDTLEEVE